MLYYLFRSLLSPGLTIEGSTDHVTFEQFLNQNRAQINQGVVALYVEAEQGWFGGTVRPSDFQQLRRAWRDLVRQYKEMPDAFLEADRKLGETLDAVRAGKPLTDLYERTRHGPPWHQSEQQLMGIVAAKFASRAVYGFGLTFARLEGVLLRLTLDDGAVVVSPFIQLREGVRLVGYGQSRTIALPPLSRKS